MRASDGVASERPVSQTTSVRSRSGQVDLSLFPSTRYRGSKRKIMSWFWGYFRQLDFRSALDVFGGTGSISYLLKRMGKQVTYNDHLKFNHLIGTALIENDEVVLSNADVRAALADRRGRRTGNRFVQDTFRGIYFTDDENRWIDAVVARISSINGRDAKSRYKRALLSYALFQSCLIKRPFNLFHRRNLYLRTADVKRAFGNKTSWDKAFPDYFARFCAEASAAVFKGAYRCRAIRFEATQIPAAAYDLVYIDPPYLTPEGDNETSDYRRSYHFLEGLCDYKQWGELIDLQTPNLRMHPMSNDWVDPERNSAAFDSLFEKFRNSVIVVSYKKFGVPGIETLIRKLKKHGRRVRTHSRHYTYALNHQNGDARLNREVLLISERGS